VSLKKLGPIFVCLVFCISPKAAQLPVTLGSTVTFAVVASSTVTNTGATILNGNLGLSTGSAVTGFPPGSVAPQYAMHIDDGVAVTAQNDLTAAYNDAATNNRDGGPVNVISGDIGGQTLTPGLYNSASTLGITGTLTLNGLGNPNSVFVFQIGSALTTAVGSSVVLINGANAANIFWQVGSSATLGTNSVFSGTILALVSITVNTGAALNGRALARTGAVTLASNTLVQPGPPITNGSGGALAVVCPANSADVGITYNSIVVATGGTPPYTYSITGGSLPAGLALNPSTGVVTGTPVTAGPDTFTVTATDSTLANANQSCSIPISVLPSTTPLPSSLSLVLIGFVCMGLYLSRERLTRLLSRS
jgi:hypothetical protein